jgi:hypothetical protein
MKLISVRGAASFNVSLDLVGLTPTTALGQEDEFPPPRLSACYVIREKTFAGTHGDGRDAPISAIGLPVRQRVLLASKI